MAERPHKSRARKSQPIEPLDWSAMARSPALKGMVSFLEVTPEDIRRQRTDPNDSRIGVRETHTGSESLTVPREGEPTSPSLEQREPVTVSASSIGCDTHVGSGPDTSSDTVTVSDTHTGGDTSTGSESHTGGGWGKLHSLDEPQPVSEAQKLLNENGRHGVQVNSVPSLDQERTVDEVTGSPKQAITESHTGIDTHTGSDSHTVSDSPTGSGSQYIAGTSNANLKDFSNGDSRTGSDALTGSNSNTDDHHSETQSNSSSVSDTRTGRVLRTTYFVPSEPYSRTPRRMPMLQGEVVWQNRKIRKCVLAQDAHSQGEDALFSAMWSAAKPDPADPTGSRTLRIGYAELAQKSRMHRSNVRINIGGLRAKLAIEVLDEHDSRDVTPRTYRLYSFKEILERRRVAGLEYVIRKKSVVFVTETGESLPLPGLPKTNNRRPRAADGSAEVRTSTKQETSPEQLDLDVRQISDAMSQHWPVDQAAAQQLLRQCRGVRRDAEIDEIVFFVNEKLQIALTNPSIKNPTGLILATVPQCFEGSTFEEFRRRRNDALRLRAEEEERKRQQGRDLQQWLDKKLQELRTIAEDVSQSEAAREKARRELKQYGG